MVGGAGSAPAIQSANVVPGGASQQSPGLRTQSSGVSSTRRAQSPTGSALMTDGMLRGGSTPSTARSREDAQPVGRPASTGELANAATSTGPSALTAANRLGSEDSSPTSTHTCRAAVAHIIVMPCGPLGAK